MRGVKMKGTILQRMTQASMMKQAVDVLKLAGELIQDAMDAGDDDILKDVIDVCEPIIEEWTKVWEDHLHAFDPRPQGIGVQRGRWSCDLFSDAVFRDLFRFSKRDFRMLTSAVGLGEGAMVRNKQRVSFTGEEAMLVCLHRLSYPGRWIAIASQVFPC